MNCPTADKLSQYVDYLLTEQEHAGMHTHVKSCARCTRVVEAFMDEQQFVKETLQTPSLPADFASSVLDELEPYEQKVNRRKKAPWKRLLLMAAGMVLAVSLSATLSPSFAEWIGMGGLFSTEQVNEMVDDGLRMAANADLAERVNLEVTDKGITFKVEDVVADSSRVALSYQVLDKSGKPRNAYLEMTMDQENEVWVSDQNGNALEELGVGMSWQAGSDYGLIEISLREQDALENITIQVDMVKLGGVKGNWKLEVPVELKENRDLTTIVSLNNATTSEHGVIVNMKEAQFAPSSNELLYETGFTKEEQEKTAKNIQLLEKIYGEDIVNSFTNYGTALQYHIENDRKETIYHYNNFSGGEGHPSDSELIQGSGRPLDKIGHMAWNESFIPQKDDDKLSFVLDGVFKTVPSDFSVSIKPKDLKKNPVSFEYEGNFMTITEAKNQQDYYLRKSIIPIGKRTHFTIKMTGVKKELSSELGAWVLVDDKGNSHLTYMSGSTDDYTLSIYGLDKVPEELTLHLLSVTRYEELKDKWVVPLYELD